MSARSTAVFLLLVAVSWQVSYADRPASRAAAQKAIAYLERDGEGWMNKRGCVSCHQIPAMIWSLRAAQESHLEVPAKLDEWAEWSTQVVNFVKPEQKEDVDIEKTMSGNIDTMAAMLLAWPGDTDASWRKHFAAALCREQKSNGSWKPCGQLPSQKRPSQETEQTTTLWVTLALLKNDAVNFRLDKAINFAGDADDSQSTERLAVGLLVAEQRGTDDRDRLKQRLLDSQNKDGGWGWVISDSSDALATGLALYALSEVGQAKGPVVDAGHEFLIATQTERGNWRVPGTKKNAKGKPTPTANYWGTGWAVIGLLSGK